jgi:hypothetical protein
MTIITAMVAISKEEEKEKLGSSFFSSFYLPEYGFICLLPIFLRHISYQHCHSSSS